MKTRPKSSDPKPTLARFLDLPFDPQELLDLLNRRQNYTIFKGRGAHEVLVAELRKLVDAWIDSGRDPQGVERPEARTTKTTIPNGNSPEIGLRERTIFDSVQRWLCENPRGIYLSDLGELQISLRYPDRKS